MVRRASSGWRRFDHGSPVRAPRRPPSCPGAGWAWALACLPALLSAIERIPDGLGAPLWLQVAVLGVGALGYAGMLRYDAARVALACPSMSGGLSNLFVPLYLWRRGAAAGSGKPAALVWCAALVLSLSLSPVRIRSSVAEALPACDANEIVAVMPGYVARDGGVRATARGRPIEVARVSPSERSCVALLNANGGLMAYSYTLVLSGADVIMSGTVEAVPGR